MKMRMNVTLWLVAFLVVVSFNTHAAEVAPSPSAAASVAADGEKEKEQEKIKEQEKSKELEKKKLEEQKKLDKSWSPPTPFFVYLVIGGTVLIGLAILLVIRNALSDTKFSLADVLSEEANITSLEADGSGGFKPRLDAAGNPVMITELRGSSSRVIAFVGMVVILLMFMGFGIFYMYAFAEKGAMPDSQYVINFLLGGAMLFAPYGANQFSALFEKLAPKK